MTELRKQWDRFVVWLEEENLFERYNDKTEQVRNLANQLEDISRRLEVEAEQLADMQPDLDRIYDELHRFYQESKGTEDEDFFEERVIGNYLNAHDAYHKAARRLTRELQEYSQETEQLSKRVEETGINAWKWRDMYANE